MTYFSDVRSFVHLRMRGDDDDDIVIAVRIEVSNASAPSNIRWRPLGGGVGERCGMWASHSLLAAAE